MDCKQQAQLLKTNYNINMHLAHNHDEAVKYIEKQQRVSHQEALNIINWIISFNSQQA